MGVATAEPSAREQIDAEHAKLGDDGKGDATRANAKAGLDASKNGSGELSLPDGLELDAGGQLSLEVGGKRPTAGTLTLTGGKVTLPKGQFAKGDRIAVRVDAVVGAVKFQDQRDSKTKQVIGCERQHFAPIENVTLMSGDVARARVLAVLASHGITASEDLALELANAALGL